MERRRSGTVRCCRSFIRRGFEVGRFAVLAFGLPGNSEGRIPLGDQRAYRVVMRPVPASSRNPIALGDATPRARTRDKFGLILPRGTQSRTRRLGGVPRIVQLSNAELIPGGYALKNVRHEMQPIWHHVQDKQNKKSTESHVLAFREERYKSSMARGDTKPRSLSPSDSTLLRIVGRIWPRSRRRRRAPFHVKKTLTRMKGRGPHRCSRH